MTMTPPRVAIVNNAIFPEIYTPVEHWAAYLPGVAWKEFRAPRGELPRLGEYSHVILSGSEASILQREAWVEREIEFVQDAAAFGTPLLGSCYGHQLLALALAGPAHVARCREPEIGWITVERGVPSPLLGPAGPADVFSAHFDEVRDLPRPFAVLAATEICPVQAFVISDRPVWGLQIHPEIDERAARRLLTAFRDVFPKFRPVYERALASPARDSRLIFGIVRAFLNFGA